MNFELPVPKSHAGGSEIRLTIAQVKKGHGSAFEYWQNMGAPANLTVVEQRALAVAAEPLYTSVMAPVTDGKVSVSLELGVNEFAFVEMGGDASGNLAELSDDQSFLNDSLMLD